MQIDQLKPIIEAALLASTQPMTLPQLGDLFNEDEDVGSQQIAQALESLAGDCEGRGIELKEVASGFRYQVRDHPSRDRADPRRGGVLQHHQDDGGARVDSRGRPS